MDLRFTGFTWLTDGFGMLRRRWARLTNPSVRRCLRCKTVDLIADENSGCFYVCPQCARRYFLTDRGRLVFRWGHPISCALYPLIFDPRPVPRAADVARRLAAAESLEWQREFIREIDLELGEPTQAVRDILACRGSDHDLREFLRLVAAHLAHGRPKR